MTPLPSFRQARDFLSVHREDYATAFSVAAENALSETCLATPAISNGTIFFRSRHHLLAFGSKPSPEENTLK